MNEHDKDKLIEQLRAKLQQCREVLREREFPYWNEHTGLHYCSSCYAQKGIFSREPHIQECAWKRAMEDA